jgi:hypothetical protein
LIQIQILINDDDTIYKIIYDDYKNKIHKENFNKTQIIEIIKTNINNINKFSKTLISKELGDLRGLNYQIFNKKTNQKSEFNSIIY